ncbi:hypothetical protein ccbrp13_56020 [Ktedonobacteria bacterium brp13]|nr:hypothetical protein ccbrp13_56020 [Ktedonobacteria bacterium brp13]
MSNELVNVVCKQGKLQVLEEGVIRVVAPFNKIAWQVPCANVTKLTTQPGSMMSVDVTIFTTQGTFTADTVTKQNFAKVEAIFPHLQTNVITGKEWYHDARALTHIEEYKDKKKMQKDVEAAAQHGWMPQDLAARNGKFSAGKAIAGGLLLGPVGLVAGAVGNKGKTTITFVRSPDWLAQNK